ncbi:MAG: nucleotidyl transferase AbiEii/AbiGii toxin family protein [bacterium]|nr:nucleotidyl transferase AbiEii/AbiGii toxin family protein [bacterium]MDE0288168.1 nucleotidyl transferase AbiEii/AbiGii toxin family protein [bacterium]MDE0437673.1 nucleotidyl transferase AbiEii/AbiGii toxin family protein [bacterium]
MLDPLQQQLRAVVDLLPEGEDFALAGGGALALRGVTTRLTRDLDYFGTSEEGVAPLADALESRLSALGYTVERTRSFPGFARLRVSTAENSTDVDLGWDARLSPPERTAGGLVLSEAELAADKVLTVADRGAPRDYIDLEALVERHGFWKAYSTAAEKQPGLDPRQLFYAFRYFGDLDRGRFQIPDAGYAQLRKTVDGWRRELTRRIQGPESDMRLAAVGGPPSDLASPPRLEFSPPADDAPCPVTHPNAVSVRPHRASDREWELLIRGTAGAHSGPQIHTQRRQKPTGPATSLYG